MSGLVATSALWRREHTVALTSHVLHGRSPIPLAAGFSPPPPVSDMTFGPLALAAAVARTATLRDDAPVEVLNAVQRSTFPMLETMIAEGPVFLLSELAPNGADDRTRPDPNEMAAAALRTLALPEIAMLRPRLVPEMPIWATDEHVLIAGRADALAISDQGVDAAIDWKSDVNPTSAVRKEHVQQLRDYLFATQAQRGAIVYLTSGELVWVENKSGK